MSEWEGGDDWLRAQFKAYLLSLFRTVASNGQLSCCCNLCIIVLRITSVTNLTRLSVLPSWYWHPWCVYHSDCVKFPFQCLRDIVTLISSFLMMIMMMMTLIAFALFLLMSTNVANQYLIIWINHFWLMTIALWTVQTHALSWKWTRNASKPHSSRKTTACNPVRN